MRIRTLLSIILALGVILAAGSVFRANHEVLQQPIRLWGDRSLPVGSMLILFFVVGAIGTLLVGMSRQVGLTLERGRLRKAGRESEALEQEYSRGLVAVLEDRDDEALDHFRDVLDRNDSHFNTLIELGNLLRGRGDHDEALELHRKAHELRKDDTRPLYSLADDYEAIGDLARASTVLHEILGVDKSSVAAWRRLRALHVKGKNWDEALEAHGKVVKLSRHDERERPFGIGIRYEIAANHLEQDRPREAVSQLRRILKEDERFLPAHFTLGDALRADGRDDDAVQAWNRGFEATGAPMLLSRIEEHHLEREQPLAAIEALKRCVARGNEDTVARFHLGKLYSRLEMLDDAFTVLTALGDAGANGPNVHRLLGSIHERRGALDRAAVEYRAALGASDLERPGYRCLGCGAAATNWAARCAECGEWNRMKSDFRNGPARRDPKLAAAPVYTNDPRPPEGIG